MTSRTTIPYYIVAMLAVVLGFYACEDDEVDPTLEIREISRLYVSFEDFATSDEGIDTTIRIIQPADSSTFSFSGSHVSQVQGGGAIYYNAFAKTLFQASANRSGVDTVIGAVSVQKKNLLNNSGSGLRSRYYKNIRGFVYHAASRTLLAVNGDEPNAGIYVIDNFSSSGNQKQPYKKLLNSELKMWGATYYNNKLFTSKISMPAGLYMFENLTTIPVQASDSVAHLNPTRTFQIESASIHLRGLDYDTVKNVMAIAEKGENEAVGSGKILIFENFSNLINGSADVIRPTRVITGANTGLVAPVDVVIDTRSSGKYLYVADSAARKISRFLYTDDGNIEPDQVIETSGLRYGKTPVGLTLDARDDSNTPRIP